MHPPEQHRMGLGRGPLSLHPHTPSSLGSMKGSPKAAPECWGHP